MCSSERSSVPPYTDSIPMPSASSPSMIVPVPYTLISCAPRLISTVAFVMLTSSIASPMLMKPVPSICVTLEFAQRSTELPVPTMG